MSELKTDLTEVKNYVVLRNIEVHMYSLLRSYTGRRIITHSLPKCLPAPLDEIAAFLRAIKPDELDTLSLVVKKLYELKPEVLGKFIDVWLQIYPEDKKIAYKTECRTTVHL